MSYHTNFILVCDAMRPIASALRENGWRDTANNLEHDLEFEKVIADFTALVSTRGSQLSPQELKGVQRAVEAASQDYLLLKIDAYQKRIDEILEMTGRHSTATSAKKVHPVWAMFSGLARVLGGSKEHYYSYTNTNMVAVCNRAKEKLSEIREDRDRPQLGPLNLQGRQLMTVTV